MTTIPSTAYAGWKKSRFHKSNAHDPDRPEFRPAAGLSCSGQTGGENEKILTILLAILLLFAVGCTVQKREQSSPEADYNKEMSEQPESAETLVDETVIDEAVADEAVDVEECEIMPLYSSIDELVSAVQTERQAKTASPEA